MRFVTRSTWSWACCSTAASPRDFKLATGTFVSVGPLRTRIVLQGHPYVRDAVLTGINRDELGVMIFPRLPDRRR